MSNIPKEMTVISGIQSRKLLAQAGYPDGRDFRDLQLEVYPSRVNIAEYLIAQGRRHLNVEVGFVAAEWKELFERKHLNDLTFGGWLTDYPDPDNFLRVCVRDNMPHWRNETYDQLLEAALRSTNREERMRLYQAADKILIEQVGIMPLTYGVWHGLAKPWVKVIKGWRGSYHKYVIIEPH